MELYEGTITSGLILTSQSFRKLGEEYIECEVTVNDFKEGNYFGGLSSINLKAGCSGSPVTIGNKKVVGVMTAGNNDNHDMPLDPKLPVNFCVFCLHLLLKEYYVKIPTSYELVEYLFLHDYLFSYLECWM